MNKVNSIRRRGNLLSVMLVLFSSFAGATTPLDTQVLVEIKVFNMVIVIWQSDSGVKGFNVVRPSPTPKIPPSK